MQDDDKNTYEKFYEVMKNFKPKNSIVNTYVSKPQSNPIPAICDY